MSQLWVDVPHPMGPLHVLSESENKLGAVEVFFDHHIRPDWTLSIYDEHTARTLEILCEPEDMAKVVAYVCEKEHTEPVSIGENNLSDSFVVIMPFNRNAFTTPNVLWWDGEKLVSGWRSLS